MIVLLFWLFLCLMLFGSVFCRLRRTTKKTHMDVRMALWLVGLVSLLGLGAPLYGWLPDQITLLIVSAVDVMQLVTASHWAKGVPRQFLYEKYLPKRRQEDRAS